MEIEKKLKADQSGRLKSEISAGIQGEIARVVAKLNRGSSPEEFRNLSALRKGLNAAQEILDRTWSYHHP